MASPLSVSVAYLDPYLPGPGGISALTFPMGPRLTTAHENGYFHPSKPSPGAFALVPERVPALQYLS